MTAELLQKQVIEHKRSVTFSRTMQLSEYPVSDPVVPAFPDITGWTIVSTMATCFGEELITMRSDGGSPNITITDPFNNLFEMVIPDVVLNDLPIGEHRIDVLFYDTSAVRRATRTFYIDIVEEVTRHVIP